MSGNSITHITLNRDEELVTRKKFDEAKPHFGMYGTGRIFMNGTRLKAVDLLYEMTQMTKAESFAFIALRDNIRYDSEARSYDTYISVSQVDFTTYQKKLFKSGITLLIEKELIKRVKRGVYMINPMAIVPNKNFSEIEALWLKK